MGPGARDPQHGDSRRVPQQVGLLEIDHVAQRSAGPAVRRNGPSPGPWCGPGLGSVCGEGQCVSRPPPLLRRRRGTCRTSHGSRARWPRCPRGRRPRSCRCARRASHRTPPSGKRFHDLAGRYAQKERKGSLRTCLKLSLTHRPGTSRTPLPWAVSSTSRGESGAPPPLLPQRTESPHRAVIVFHLLAFGGSAAHATHRTGPPWRELGRGPPSRLRRTHHGRLLGDASPDQRRSVDPGRPAPPGGIRKPRQPASSCGRGYVARALGGLPVPGLRVDRTTAENSSAELPRRRTEAGEPVTCRTGNLSLSVLETGRYSFRHGN